MRLPVAKTQATSINQYEKNNLKYITLTTTWLKTRLNIYTIEVETNVLHTKGSHFGRTCFSSYRLATFSSWPDRSGRNAPGWFGMIDVISGFANCN